MPTQKQLVTIYVLGAFGTITTKGNLVDPVTPAEVKDRISIVPPGKRKVQTYNTKDRVIFKGDKPTGPNDLTGMAPQTRYGCYDPRYTVEHDQFMDQLIGIHGGDLICDRRNYRPGEPPCHVAGGYTSPERGNYDDRQCSDARPHGR